MTLCAGRFLDARGLGALEGQKAEEAAQLVASMDEVDPLWRPPKGAAATAWQLQGGGGERGGHLRSAAHSFRLIASGDSQDHLQQFQACGAGD